MATKLEFLVAKFKVLVALATISVTILSPESVGLEKDALNRARWKKGSWRDCCQNGVNPATIVVYGDKPGSELDDICHPIPPIINPFPTKDI